MFAKRYKHVLVTGGAGFIGSHLVEALLDDGCAVTVIDDLSTGSWDNIAHLEGREGFRAVISSAADRELLAVEIPRHDFVFHLASAVGVKNIVDHPVNTVQSIFGPTEAVLDFCARYRRPFLLTSTSEVYGKSEAIPFSEESDTVMGPTEKRRWAYACAKALDEFLALAHHHETRLPVYIVRLFNTVGRRQTGQYGMVVPSFVKRALAGEPLLVHGDGEQQRCFCSVLDVVQGLMKVPLCKEAVGRVVNLGSQEEVSIKELARRIIAATGSKSELRLVSYQEIYGDGFDDMRRRVPDLTRARNLIGWAPRHSLEDIIQQVISGLRDA